MKLSKKSFVILLVGLLIALTPLSATAAKSTSNSQAIKVKSQPIQMIFDGEQLSLPKGQHSFIYKGSTYVPIRYMSYALLKQVLWNGTKNVVTVKEPTEKELIELKKLLQLATGVDVKPKNNETITITPKKVKLIFEGKEKALPVGQSLYSHNGSIYVPLRFLAEATGAEITWDQATKTVKSESAAYREQFGEKEEGGSGTGEGGTGGTVTNPGTVPGGTPGAVKPTYEQITSSALTKLEALRSSCETSLMDMVLKHEGKDEEAKKQLLAKITNEVDSCTKKFETIVSDVSSQLSSNGYRTAIIAEYRAKFEADLKTGKEIAEKLLK